MTEQYGTENINYGPSPAFVSATALLGGDQQGSDASNDTVFNFTPVVNSSADHFTVTSTTALGSTFTILQPGAYVASLTAAIAAGAQTLAISLGGAVDSFGATPAAMGGANVIIALAGNAVANASISTITTSFRITPANISDGTANIVRFLGDASGVWVATQVGMRIDRITAAS
jgi:hypothetical protein